MTRTEEEEAEKKSFPLLLQVLLRLAHAPAGRAGLNSKEYGLLMTMTPADDVSGCFHALLLLLLPVLLVLPLVLQLRSPQREEEQHIAQAADASAAAVAARAAVRVA